MSIGKYAIELVELVEKLSNSSTGSLILLSFVFATLIVGAIILYTHIETMGLSKTIPVMLGTLSTVILIPAVYILGSRGMYRIKTIIENFNSRKKAKKRLEKWRQEPKLKHR